MASLYSFHVVNTWLVLPVFVPLHQPRGMGQLHDDIPSYHPDAEYHLMEDPDVDSS